MGPHPIRTSAPDDAELRRALSSVHPEAAAIDHLRRYLRGALAKALRGRVDDPDLDDFTQAALLQVLESLHTFRGESRFTTWAAAVAIRSAFGALRRRRHPTVSLSDLGDEDAGAALRDPSPDADPAERAADRQDLERLVEALRTELTPRQRAAVLGELRGASTEQLAEDLGITRNAFYKLHHDARLRLRRAVLERPSRRRV